MSDKNQHLDSVITWLREEHADVVLLQEAASDWFGTIQPKLQDLYPYQDQQFTDRGSRSNLTFSRFPITGSPTMPTPSVPIRSLLLDVEGHPISFYNVSLAILSTQRLAGTCPSNILFLTSFCVITMRSAISRLTDYSH